MTRGVDESQRKAARVVGAAYLVAMATAMFAEAYVRGRLVVDGDALATARNIMGHTTLFRVGIVSELATFATDVALITALYVVLAPVSRHLALFAAFLRLTAESASGSS